MINQEYLSDKEVAKFFSISRPTVWRWVQEGKLSKPFKLSAGCTRWRKDDVINFKGA